MDETLGGTPLTAVSQRSLSEEVADRIRDGIVTGRLEPGLHLLEADLSHAMEVSRSPVRDALAQLHHEGLVTLRRHRGAVVVSMSPRDIEDVYSLRRSLEELAVRLATERAGDDDLSALKRAAGPVSIGSAGAAARQFAEADIRFHDLIYQAAHHDRLYGCWSMLRPHIFRFLLTRNIANADYKLIYKDEHMALAQRIAARDSAAAADMIGHHLQGSYSRLVGQSAVPEDPSKSSGANP